MAARRQLIALGLASVGISLAAYVFFELDDTQGGSSGAASFALADVEDPISRTERIMAPDAARAVPRLRVRTITRPHAPEMPLAAFLADFEADAKAGDADAAYVLARALRSCQNVPGTSEGRLKQLASLRESSLASGRDQETAEALVAKLGQRHEFCANVSQEVVMRWYSYFELAAALGSAHAMFEFSTTNPPWLDSLEPTKLTPSEDAAVRERIQALRERALGYLTALRDDSGVAQAMEAVALEHYYGVVTKRDLIAAYANFAAASAVNRSSSRPDGGAALLEQIHAQLREDERVVAEAMAQAILSRPGCCSILDKGP